MSVSLGAVMCQNLILLKYSIKGVTWARENVESDNLEKRIQSTEKWEQVRADCFPTHQLFISSHQYRLNYFGKLASCSQLSSCCHRAFILLSFLSSLRGSVFLWRISSFLVNDGKFLDQLLSTNSLNIKPINGWKWSRSTKLFSKLLPWDQLVQVVSVEISI